MSLTVNRVVFKFIETALRSLSILLATYALDTYSAGLFALILTFQGFASLFLGLSVTLTSSGETLRKQTCF